MCSFLAFNGGSELGISGGHFKASHVGRACTNTVLSAAAAAISAVLITKLGYAKEEVTICRVRFTTVHPFGGHWSLIVLINGAITGMVSICAGCAYVEPWAAVCIGFVAGWVYVGINKIVEMAMIDDPVGAIAVHLGGGFWGVVAVMLFAHNNRIPHIADGGVLYAWDRNSFVGLGKNALGGACIAAWTAVWSALIFGAMLVSGHLRVSPEAEEDGMDFIEGEPAYPIDLAVFSE
jgi:ammonium transporter, Amt family